MLLNCSDCVYCKEIFFGTICTKFGKFTKPDNSPCWSFVDKITEKTINTQLAPSTLKRYYRKERS